MKKKIIMIFSILFLLLFCYLFYLNYLGKSSNNITTYAKQLNIDEKTDKLLAVKYSNSIKDPYLNKLEDKPTIYSNDGEELYLIVPIKKNLKLSIYQTILGEVDIEKENFLGTETKPFIVKGNISDIIPNMLIEFQYKNKIYNYSPSLSLKDGSLNLEEFILDLDKIDNN